jgi:hypothetical protein
MWITNTNKAQAVISQPVPYASSQQARFTHTGTTINSRSATNPAQSGIHAAQQ